MKRPAVTLIFLSILIFMAHTAVAAVSVTLELDRNETTLKEPVTLRVRVSGARSSDAPPVIQGLERFHVTRGGSASRVEIVNGQYHSGVDFTYYIQPKEKGVFKVGPAKIEVDGKTWPSNVATLKVTDGGSASGSQKDPVFLRAKLGLEKAYVEQQVPYVLRLYLRTNVSDISLDLPETGDLSFRQREKPKEYQSVIDGVPCRVLEVSYGVVPLKPGSYTILPARMGMTVYSHQKRRQRGLFDDPFFGSVLRTGRPLTVKSEPLVLEVLPFPEQGKPGRFSGLVGQFEIEANLSGFEVSVGDSVTLTVRLWGDGNANRLPDLKMPAMDHFKTYADEPVFEVKPGMNGLMGSKTMKWALVPDQPGNYTVPPFGVSYFDPKKRIYHTIRTKPLVLKVLPGKEESLVASQEMKTAGEPSNNLKREVKEIGHDILPIRTSTADIKINKWFSTKKMTSQHLLRWVVLLVPLLVYGGVLLVLQYHKKSGQAIYAQRARRAAGNFMRECPQSEEDADGMMTAVREYINNRFQLSMGSLTPDEVPGLLVEKGVEPHTAKDLQTALEELEALIYADGEATCGALGRRISEIIKRIEKELR